MKFINVLSSIILTAKKYEYDYLSEHQILSFQINVETDKHKKNYKQDGIKQ